MVIITNCRSLHAEAFTTGQCGGHVEKAVQACMVACHEQIVGLQVCVVRHGKRIVDACAGRIAEADPRPMRYADLSCTLLPC